ncbi:murein L,D-transpeptidase [Bdellovibrio bacteriovorus]|uniref:L,D-transpeptidase family protein n=1 Tax=Bdellovibrio TaxID=958 RepID=UPI0035A95D81
MMMKNWIKKSFIVGMSFVVLAPQFSLAQSKPQIIQDQVTRARTNPIINPKWGSFLLRTDRLNKLYSLRGYEAIWVDSSGYPNAMLNRVKSIFQDAEKHGLNPSDYWDDQIEKGFQATQKNPGVQWITFELLVTEALIRYVSHLSGGRFDPEQIDTDIKFKKKEFNEFTQLNAAISYGPESLSTSLDGFAPTHPRYRELMGVLAQLKDMKGKGGWPTINSPGFALKLGVKDPSINQLRERFNQLGYRISYNGGNTFDSEFDQVLRQYQSMNGLTADGIIGTRSEVLRALNFTVNQRIGQVEVTMEKLRWLPTAIEQRHIFVNLATTEFRLYDENGKTFHFKTVNGQPFRRTPSMKDSITFVNLNPYWTVPRSIAIRDKLPLLKQDRFYLEKHNMLLIDEGSDEVVDSTSIDWRSMNARNFTYYIRQLPGPDNALGVVKFPLQNPWAIYMHDTNEKQLFGESKRHRSSGCVRLEQPLDLAAYLLRDQAGWSLEDIKSYVPLYDNNIPGEIDKKVFLKKAMPVYFLYLTVEKTEDGAFRFVDDVYGQDTRVSKALQNKKNSNELF